MGHASIFGRGDIPQTALNHDASMLVGLKALQLSGEALAPANDSGDKVVQGFAFNCNGCLISLNRVVTRWQCLPDTPHTTSVETIGMLLSGIDDDRDAGV